MVPTSTVVREREVFYRPRFSVPFSRISWGGIFVGLFVLIALQMIFTLLGAGIGLSVVRPTDDVNPSAAAITLGVGLWWVVTNWIALVAGGYIAGRLAGSHHGHDGCLHGTVTWALGLVVAGVVLAGAVGTGASVAGKAVATVAAPAAAGAGAAAVRATDGSGLNVGERARELLRPNDPATLSDEAALAEVTTGAARIATGSTEVDRDRLAKVIAAKGGVTEDEAKARIDQWEQKAKQVKEEAKQAADKAVVMARHTAIWGFLVILIGAIAAALGGFVGARAVAAEDDEVVELC